MGKLSDKNNTQAVEKIVSEVLVLGGVRSCAPDLQNPWHEVPLTKLGRLEERGLHPTCPTWGFEPMRDKFPKTWWAS